MTPSTKTETAAPALRLGSDRPPVGRFFIAFCTMLALAIGLAALSEAGAVAGVDVSSADEQRAEAASR